MKVDAPLLVLLGFRKNCMLAKLGVILAGVEYMIAIAVRVKLGVVRTNECRSHGAHHRQSWLHSSHRSIDSMKQSCDAPRAPNAQYGTEIEQKQPPIRYQNPS
eukprot:scaffold34941_cov167-Amphora_coffeaeformis.AAC.5